jgi:SEC-C motif domain protein
MTNVTNPANYTKPAKPAESDLCPCCSGQTFGQCCGPVLSGKSPAADAEKLMRSRYTAHVLHDDLYLHRTYLPSSKLPYVEETEQPTIKWTKLEVHSHTPEVRPNTSWVEFSAYFEERGQKGVLQEKSEFQCLNGAWIFTKTLRNGPAPIRAAAKAVVGRNDPCPCGSGKKYKQCCL